MTPISPISYGRRLAQLADELGDEVAVRFAAPGGEGGDGAHERELTWSALDRGSNRQARALARRGVGVGDRVALALRNSPELVTGVFAAWKLGAVPVPVRWDLPDWERGRVLEVVDAKVDLDADDLPCMAKATSGPAAEDDGPLPDATPPQTHGICSSGSTGTPKVIVMDVPAVWDGTAEPFVTGWMDVPRPQVVLVPAPLYHTNGFATLTNLLAGDRLVVLERFDSALVLDLIERHRVTTFTATPTMLQRIADVPGVERRDLGSLVWILQGASTIAPSLVRRWFDLVGPERFFMAYGMTEGLGLAAQRGDEWLAHPGSVGRGYRETEIRIVGPDGREQPPGEVGEIYLRSPSAPLCRYLGGAEPPAKTPDGFGTGGDLGWLDGDGYLYVADRRVDLIVTGGANVYPAEVESALSAPPAIADGVVIGLADAGWGRRVHAVVEPADRAAPPDPSDVVAFAKARLAPYKVPKTVELVDRIPRSEATKVSRSALVAERGG